MVGDVGNTASLRSWLAARGGSFHPAVVLAAHGPFGASVLAPPRTGHTTVVTCPFSLIITPRTSLHALHALLGHPSLDTWSPRQLICSYLCFHHLFSEQCLPDSLLRHLPYVRCLPPAEHLATPLQFAPAELDVLRGTNLYGATLDRERDCRMEWLQCRSILRDVNQAWADAFTWEMYVTAATHLSSRAFPSSILSADPSLVASPSTYPVLIPGVDLLNHKRGQPVSWIVSCQDAATDMTTSNTVSIVAHSVPDAPGDQQLTEVFNNYGPKPNDELILGYGFSLPDNPDDKIMLQIGGSATSQKWAVGRQALNVEGLWSEARSMIACAESDHEFEDDLETAAVLSDMVQAKLDGMKTVADVRQSDGIRPTIKVMLEHYITGQRDILESILEFLNRKQEAAIEMAREQGIDIVFED